MPNPKETSGSFADFVAEVDKWELGLSPKSKEELVLWGRLLSKEPEMPPDFVMQYDYLLHNSQ